MNKAVYTLVDKIEHQLSVTSTLLAELHTLLGERPQATKSITYSCGCRLMVLDELDVDRPTCFYHDASVSDMLVTDQEPHRE